LHERAKRTLTLLIAGQLSISIVTVALVTAVAGWDAAYSVLVGGLIGILPNYYFAGRLMRSRASAAALQSLREIYVGEFIKIAFTSALFVIAIIFLNVKFLVVVLTYFALVVVNWLAFLVADLGEMPRHRQTPRNVVQVGPK